MVQSDGLRATTVVKLRHQRRTSRRVRVVEGIGLLPRLKSGSKLLQKTSLEQISQISFTVDLSLQPFIHIGGVILPLLIAPYRKCFGFDPQFAGTPVKLTLFRIPAGRLISAPGGSTRNQCQN